MDKLKRQLAEAEAAMEERKKPPEDTGPRVVAEWVGFFLFMFSLLVS